MPLALLPWCFLCELFSIFTAHGCATLSFSRCCQRLTPEKLLCKNSRYIGRIQEEAGTRESKRWNQRIIRRSLGNGTVESRPKINKKDVQSTTSTQNVVRRKMKNRHTVVPPYSRSTQVISWRWWHNDFSRSPPSYNNKDISITSKS